MANSTTLQRQLFFPPCKSKGGVFVAAYMALDFCFRFWNYKPILGVTGSFNCRKITGGTGYSLHAYGPGVIFVFWTGVRVTTALAVDVNWDKNPYGPRLVTDMPRAMIDAILAIRTKNGKQVWGWGGYYSGNKDAMHFEVVCSAADLGTGINPSTLPQLVTQPTTPTPAPSEEDEDLADKQIIWFKDPKKPDTDYHPYLIGRDEFHGVYIPGTSYDVARYVYAKDHAGKQIKESGAAEKGYDINIQRTYALENGPCQNV